MRLPPKVTIVEVGPRDGLQNERAAVSTTDKIAFVDRLTAAGHQLIEVSAFVSPKWVPQMADASEVFAGITRRPGTRYTALVPNQKGLARAVAAGVSEVAIFAAASETFSRRNINQSIDESLVNYAAVCADARAAGLRVRGYLSTCFVCPFEGPVDPVRVAEISGRLLDIGVYEVAISDTIGAATPGDGAPCPRNRQRQSPSASDSLAFSRYAGHGACERARRPGLRRDDVRQFRRWPRRLPLRAGRGGQSRDGRSVVHAEWHGHRDRRGHRPSRRRVALDRDKARSQTPVAISTSATNWLGGNALTNWQLATGNLPRIRPGEDSAGADSSPEGFMVGMGLTRKFQRLTCLSFPYLTPRSHVVTR